MNVFKIAKTKLNEISLKKKNKVPSFWLYEWDMFNLGIFLIFSDVQKIDMMLDIQLSIN